MISNHVEKLVTTTSRVKTLKRPNHHATENLLRQSVSSKTEVVRKSPYNTHERNAKAGSPIETENILNRLHPRSLVLHIRMNRASRHAAIKTNRNPTTIGSRGRSEVLATASNISKDPRRKNPLQKKSILRS